MIRFSILITAFFALSLTVSAEIGVYVKSRTSRVFDYDTNGRQTREVQSTYTNSVLKLPNSRDTAGFYFCHSTNANDGTQEMAGFRPLFSVTNGGHLVFLADDFISISTNSTLFDPNEAFTMMAWCKPAEFVYNRVFSQGSTSSGVPSVDISADNSSQFRMFLRSDAGASKILITTTPASVGTWYHVTVTYDGTTDYKIYLNGIEEDSDGTGDIGTITLNHVAVGVFARTAFNNHWNGGLDDINIYPEWTASNQVLEAYAAEPLLTEGGKR